MSSPVGDNYSPEYRPASHNDQLDGELDAIRRHLAEILGKVKAKNIIEILDSGIELSQNREAALTDREWWILRWCVELAIERFA